MSDLVIVVAKTNPEAKGSAAMSLFLVDPKLAGFSKGNPLKKAGLKAQDTCELFFEDVVLPPDALLGDEGRGFAYLMEELPQVNADHNAAMRALGMNLDAFFSYSPWPPFGPRDSISLLFSPTLAAPPCPLVCDRNV
eukprot:scaffold207100_cov35-Tisochrysis_lutea.AAC.3